MTADPRAWHMATAQRVGGIVPYSPCPPLVRVSNDHVSGGNLATAKSVGPRKFLERHCPDVLRESLTHGIEARAIDDTAEIHRDPGVVALSAGGSGPVQAHFNRLRNQYVFRREDDTVETRVVFWCYDNAEYVPVVKHWTQAGRITKVDRSELVLDVVSQEPLPSGTGFQAMLRATGDHDRAARGVRDFLLRHHSPEDRNLPTLVFSGVADGAIAGTTCGDSVSHLEASSVTSTTAPAPASCSSGALRHEQTVDSGGGDGRGLVSHWRTKGYNSGGREPFARCTALGR